MALGAGTTPQRVAEVEQALDASFPDDYVRFLVATNGGEGLVGEEGYGWFYSVEELLDANRSYKDFEQFAGLVIFGSDGGGEAFCFDSDGSVVLVAYISGPEDNVTIGPFKQFMRRLAEGNLL